MSAPVQTGGTIVTGTNIVNTAFDQQKWREEMELKWFLANAEVENAKAELAAAQADAAARTQVGMAQVGATLAGIASNERIAQAEQALKRAQLDFQIIDAERQFGLDVQRFGLEKAAQAWREKVDTATFQLDVERFGLDKAAFNAQQRQAVLDGKLRALELLAAKSGPQDWVAYNNLVNNMTPPDALARGEVNPLSFVEGLYEPYTGGPSPTLGGTAAGGGGGGTLVGGDSFTGGALGGRTGFTPETTAPPTTYGNDNVLNALPPTTVAPGMEGGGAATRKTQLGQVVNGAQMPEPASLVTAGQGMPPGTVMGGSGPLAPPPPPSGSTSGTVNGVPYTVSVTGATPTPISYTTIAPGVTAQPMAMGGVTNAGRLLVGEQGPEIIENTGQEDPRGRDLIRVIPNHNLVAAASGGTFTIGDQNSLVSLASGGANAQQQAYEQPAGTYGAGNPNTFSWATYRPEDYGNQPFIQKLQGGMPSQQFGGFGAALSNPSLGIANMPWALNYNTLANLYPTEQQQAKSLYEQGLGVSFADVLEQSRRAAPIGRTLRRSSYSGV